MNKLKRWSNIGCLVLASVVLANCGSSNSSSTANLRVVNATITHQSLDLLIGASVVVPATVADNASAYASVAGGSETLQLNDAATATALVSTIASLAGGQHFALVAYESGGAVKTAVLTEDFVAPAAGTAQLRIYDIATDAGALDVYVTAPTTDLSTVPSPTLTITADLYAASSGWLVYNPGTYRLRVTGAGNKADMRIDMPVTVTALQVATVVLAPASGGLLLNGSTLIQQGTYAASRNTTARLRLAAAVSASAKVDATAGSTAIDAGSVSPSVGTYVVVPASGVLAVNVNNVALVPPAAGLTAGSDATLLVYGDPGNATASLIADDNRRPSSSTNVRMRLVNAVTGTLSDLTMTANFAPVATNVTPGTVSDYGLVAASTGMQLEVTSPLKQTPLYTSPILGLNIAGDSVYTMFMMGDFGAPQPILRRDR